MNKKFKLAIPFAVLALSCGIVAGCGGHEHSYTELVNEGTTHVMVCPDCPDKAKDESTREDHEFVDGSCECGAVMPVVDVTITNGTASDANGTLAIDRATVKAGEKVTVTVTANEGYQLKDLTVNGEGVFGAMTGNTYTFTATEDTTVVAEFEKIASSSVNSVITGKKYGVTGNSLTAGTQVTLSAKGKEDVTATLETEGENLVLKVAEIAGADWDVKVDGYAVTSIAIKRDMEYNAAIALEYDLMENLSTGWGHGDKSDLSNMNGGSISHVSGYYQWISSKTSYSSVAFTAKAVKGGYRQGVFLRFKGDTYADDGFVMLEKENQEKVCWNGAGDGYTGKNLFNGHWDNYISPLDKDEYDLTLVREGVNIYVFVDGEFKGTKTLKDEYADRECYVGLFCTDAEKIAGKERTFRIEDASAFLDINITNGTASDAHGTVNIDKTTASLKETVTVTLTPEKGYKIKDLWVGGVSVLDKLVDNTYTFEALKSTTVVAEFEENKLVDSAVITVSSTEAFKAEGAKLTFEQLGKTWTGTVTEGKVTLGGTENPVAIGLHNVTAEVNGLTIKLGTVTVAATNDSAATGAGTLTLDGSTIFANAESAAAGYDLKDLSITLDLKNDGKAYHNKLVTGVPESDTNYVLYKLSLPEAMKTKLTQNADKKLNLSMPVVVNGAETTIKFVMQNGTVKYQVYGDSIRDAMGNFWGEERTLDAKFWSALTEGDGFYLVVNIDKTDKKLSVYLDTAINAMRPAPDFGVYGEVKTIGISMGNAVDVKGLDAGDQITVAVKYGKTMQDIGMGLEDRVSIDASVNDDAFGKINLDSKDGKYFTRTECTVTLTATAGYYLASIKIGDADAVTEGWTQNGNVYTFKFTVPDANTTFVATFNQKDMWETATLTLNGVAEGTKVELYSDLYSVTATVGANGVLTLSGETKITKEVYTVYVGNVEFTVDFTDQSEYTKTIVTATTTNEESFTARDTVKVLDMGNAKNVTQYGLTFNLKTTSEAAGWQQRWSILLVDGNDGMTTGIGCIGKNDNQLLVWAAYGSSPDDRSPVKYSEAKYLKFDELVHSANGVNLKVVRNGSKATMYFELNEEWVEMLSVTLGNGATNLKFACNNGVEWRISDVSIDYVSYEVSVTPFVNDNTLGSIELDKTSYNNGDMCTVTVTVNEGNELKSLTIGGETLTTGWTKGENNTYTYSFRVMEDATVSAELEGKKVWESATLTLNGVAADTEVKLTDGVDTITAVVGADGVVTLAGETQIGKKVYTVYVGNVVFEVDFTTESAIEKVIATVTADDFTAKNQDNGNAKVIEMGAAKDATDYSVTFNLKTTTKGAATWTYRFSLLLIDGNDNTITGIGSIPELDGKFLVWGAIGAQANDKDPNKLDDAKLLQFDGLVKGDTGANIKVVRNGSKATMYFDLNGEWVKMLTVTLGSGATNLKFACNNNVDWQLSNIKIEYVTEVSEPTFTATTSITRNPTANVDITVSEDYEVLAYDRIGTKDGDPAHVSSDETKVNVNEWLTTSGSPSFGGKGYTVTGGEGIADGSCVYIGNGNATLVINKDVKAIRIYVGAWNGETAQTGKFTLKDGNGNVIAELEYANDGEAEGPNKDGKNDVIEFLIDASALTEDMTCTLNYTLSSGNLPCAGIQLLGEKTTVTE